MFEFLHRTEYIRAKQNEEYYHFGFVEVPSPDWQMVLNSLEFAIINSKQENPNPNQEFEEIKDYGFMFNFPLNEPKEHRIFTDFLNSISSSHLPFRKRQLFSACNFMSLSSVSKTLERNDDIMDVWCWQILGFTHMVVEGRERVFDKVLEPGELIYIPRGMKYSTKPMGPRSLISFGSKDMES